MYRLPRLDLYIQLYPVYTVRIMFLEHIFVPKSQLGWFSCWCEDTPPWAACVGWGTGQGASCHLQAALQEFGMGGGNEEEGERKDEWSLLQE